MSGIKIKDYGTCQSIETASGDDITPSKYQVGMYFLYCKLYKYCQIIGINGDTIQYENDLGAMGMCSKANFRTKWPTEATDEEIAFIDRQLAAEKGSFQPVPSGR